MLQASEWQVLNYLTLAEGPVFVSQIARDIGLSKGAVSKALAALEPFGVLLCQRQGTMAFFQVDRRSAVVAHLRIAFTLVELESQLMALRTYAHKIILFGSCAQGTDTAASDIDLFVVAKDKEKALKMCGRVTLSRPLQWVVKTPQEYVALPKKEPVFADEVKKGIVMWEDYETA